MKKRKEKINQIKFYKTNSMGVSLIVLVITIIIILILASAIILMMSGENDVVTMAREAKSNNRIVDEKEQISLAVGDSRIANRGAGISASDLQAKLDEAGINAKVSGSNPLKVTFLNSNRTYKVENGEIILIKTTGNWQLNDDGTISLPGETKEDTITFEIGAKIGYKCSEVVDTSNMVYTSDKELTNYSKDQTFSLANYTGNWRVFGVENGKLVIISDVITPDDSSYYALKGQNGYVNGVSELNNICNFYGQGKNALGGRSIVCDDIDKITGYDKTTYKIGELYEYGNIVTYERLESDVKYYGTKNSVGGTFSFSSEAAFIYYNGSIWKNLAEVGEKCVIESNYYTYDAGSMVTDSNMYEILFGSSGLNYWLADEFIRPIGDYANYGVKIIQGSAVERNYLFMTNNNINDPDTDNGFSIRVGIRALVYIDSGIELTQDENGVWQMD